MKYTFRSVLVSERGAIEVGLQSGFLAAPGLFGGTVIRLFADQGRIKYSLQLSKKY